MSSAPTHMLIGTVAGIGLVRLLPLVRFTPRPTATGEQMLAIGIVIGSALLATWPDINQPGSFISRRVHTVLTLLFAVGGGLLGYLQWQRLPILRVHDPLGAATLLAVLGTVLGYGIIGPAVLHGLKYAAGGHRRLTHSLVCAGVLAGIAVLLWQLHAGWWLLVPLALVYGQLVHLIGDLVTVGGCPLAWPLSERDVRVLPRAIAHYGERIIIVVAFLVGWVCLH